MTQHNALRRIHTLPQQLANQIAAGEVVERPSSVVKELLENSIDAGARQIDIDIEQGGIALIRLRDDGGGIHKDDLALALSPHATSKIYHSADLDGIVSLGFRGEALASIASVSRMAIASCTLEEGQGWRIDNEGDAEPVPSPQLPGTQIEVRDLFFNTPARRKFLRTERTEYLHIEDVVRRVALSRFDIGFSLQHNSRQIFKLPPLKDDTGQERRLTALLGKPFVASARKVEFSAAGMRLWGWVLPPDAARSQADIQFVFLNGRVIRDKLVNHAVRQAYSDYLAQGRHAGFLLYLELDPRMVDVNVHPTKHEVRFRESRMVHDFLIRAIREALGGGSGEQRGADAGEIDVVETTPLAQPSYRQPLQARPERARIGEQMQVYSALHRDTKGDDKAPGEGPPAASLGTPIGIVLEQFLLAENGDELILINRKAAQQLLVYRQLCEAWSSKGHLTSRPLLIPANLSIAKGAIEALLADQERLSLLGFELDRWSETALVVRQIPALLNGVLVEPLMADICSVMARREIDEDGGIGLLLRTLASHAPLVGAKTVSHTHMRELLQALATLSPGARVHKEFGVIWCSLGQDELLTLLSQTE